MIRRDEPLAKHTTLRVGGPADVFMRTGIGNGPGGCRAPIAAGAACRFSCLAAARTCWCATAAFAGSSFAWRTQASGAIEIVGERLHCGAGAKLKDVAVEARRNGLSGLEFLEGIPGSVGGALRMNAGAMGGAMFEVVESVRLMDFDGEVRELDGPGDGGAISQLRDLEDAHRAVRGVPVPAGAARGNRDSA